MLEAADLLPVPLERRTPRSLAPEQLPFEDESLDARVEHLDAR